MAAQFEAVCRPKFMTFGTMYRRPRLVVNTLNRLSISCFIPKIYAVKVAVKLRSRPKRWFWGPRFIGERIPQSLDMRFQIAVTSEHVADFG